MNIDLFRIVKLFSFGHRNLYENEYCRMIVFFFSICVLQSLDNRVVVVHQIHNHVENEVREWCVGNGFESTTFEQVLTKPIERNQIAIASYQSLAKVFTLNIQSISNDQFYVNIDLPDWHRCRRANMQIDEMNEWAARD